MTWNLIGYLIYGLITIYTILVIGKRLHRDGIFFVQKVFPEGETGKIVNNLLLLGYYLVNIGYAFMTISSWQTISGLGALFGALAEHIGLIYLLLAVLHYNNILCLRLYAKWNDIDLFHSKTTAHDNG